MPGKNTENTVSHATKDESVDATTPTLQQQKEYWKYWQRLFADSRWSSQRAEWTPLKTKKTGYGYYNSRAKTVGFDENSIGTAISFGQQTLEPSLSNLDYLVLKPRKHILEKWFSELNEHNLRVLDVGGRIQPYRPLFTKILGTYFAVDLQFHGLVDVVANAESLPFGANAFDVVLCMQTLHYVNNPFVAMTEIHRVLRPGGRLFLTTPSLFPEHHDHLWRFLPDGLRFLTRHFSEVEIQPEGHSAAGLLRAINITVHRDIENYYVLRIAEKTTIPVLNLLGVFLDVVAPRNTRSTANYSLMAVK